MKKLEDVSKPDPRVGLFQQPTVETLYKSASSWSLAEQVPKQIRELWEVGQYQFIYSYYCYEFIPVTRLFCYFSLEAAFKEVIKRKTKNIPKNFGSAIGQLNSVFPEISKSIKVYLKNLNNMRDFMAHPPGRTLEFWGDGRQKELATLINGLFYFEKPHLLVPLRFLYNPLEFYKSFAEPKPKYFPFYGLIDDACVHISRGVEMIKNCKQHKVAITYVRGGLEAPTVFEWGTHNLDMGTSDGNDNSTWESYRKKREDLAIEEISKWPNLENLFLKFDFKHEEEWYTEKMNFGIEKTKTGNGPKATRDS